MTRSHEALKTGINTVIDSEVLERIKPRMTKTDEKKNIFLSAIFRSDSDRKAKRNEYKKKMTEQFPYVSGRQQIKDHSIFEGNIENCVGTVQIPLGIVGPLKLKGVYATGEFFVPMATTEGALVASYNRGTKVIQESGGAQVMCLSDSICRVPGFVFGSLLEATQFVAWCHEHLSIFKELVLTTTCHGRLQQMHSTIDGNRVFLHFEYTTKDAAGQNMVTIATHKICAHIAKRSPVRVKKWYIEANMSGDKKPAQLSQIMGRGKTVSAEVVVPASVVKRRLYTNPEEIVRYSQTAALGSMKSGAMGVQGHFANALAAIFIACGQDAACVSEAASGISRAELTDQGDLYVSVTLPNLIVGTVGGGTHLPTQKECLEMMGCAGKGHARKLAEIVAATVLAGEISIAAAIAGGYFTKAHEMLARKKKRTPSRKKGEKRYVSAIH